MAKTIQFDKYQGAGNDFVIIDNRKSVVKESDNKLIEFLCDRHFGIGADGLILLQEKAGYDFEMRFFNCDGFPASMCGNGARCIVSYASKLGLSKGKVNFLAPDGPHEAELLGERVSLKMTDVSVVEKGSDYFFLNTGVPHYVTFVKDLDNIEVRENGKKIRYSEQFAPKGTNVNFVEIIDNGLKIRTYERGVEGETLACGTGITAAAIAYGFSKNINSGKVPVFAKGGDLSVSFKINSDNTVSDIWLEGPAKHVFSGTIEV